MKHHLTGIGLSAIIHGVIAMMAIKLFVRPPEPPKPPAPAPITLAIHQFQTPVTQPNEAKQTTKNIAPTKVEPAKPASQKPMQPAQQTPKTEKKPRPAPTQQPLTTVVKKVTPVVASKPIKQTPPPKPQTVKSTHPRPESTTVTHAITSHTTPAASRSMPAPISSLPTPNAVTTPPIATKHPPTAPLASKVATRPAAPIPINNAAAEASYRRRLENLIASRKTYPSMAEKMEAEGTASVSFTVLKTGAITGTRIVRSSGNQWLDKAATQAVQSASGALPFPPDINKAQWSFTVNVNFHLD